MDKDPKDRIHETEEELEQVYINEDMDDNTEFRDFSEAVENPENSEEKLFEEAVRSSSFSSGSRNLQEIPEEFIFDEELDDLSTSDYLEDIDYHPGDLVDLRRLFDEDAVDPSHDGITLDFEEIPDDIDIDEPIEIEKLSRAGRIMNVVVKATLIIFALVILGFIINAGLVIGAVLSTNFNARMFFDISNLDKTTANIDATIMTEETHFGSFIVGSLDPISPVRARFYLCNTENPKAEDAMFEIVYQPPEEKGKFIKFNGGVKNVLNLNNIELKLNPEFDSSRLSGFMEPRNGDKFHERYPHNIIVDFSVVFIIESFWVPIPYHYSNSIKTDMTQINAELEKKRAEQMAKFDFNPKFIDISDPKSGKLTLQVRQPVPKFFAPPFYNVAIHMPSIDLVLKQFTMKDPEKTPDIVKLFKETSKHLAVAKVKPFKMILTEDDMTPNILDLEVELDNDKLDGLKNVLKAIRDEQLGTLAFLFASKAFKPQPESPVAADSNVPRQSKLIKGCTLSDFLKTFWGRQVYPVGDGKTPAPPLPSYPEFYDPSKEPALKIHFNGLIQEKTTNFLTFRFTANTHYVISEYKLPLLMISGEIPPAKFKMLLKGPKRQPEIVSVTVKHVCDSPKDALNGSRILGKHLIMDVFVEIKDLRLLSLFALKMSRMSQVSIEEGSKIRMEQIIGKMFKGIDGAEIVADETSSDASLVTKVASVFNMKFNLSEDKVEFLYIGNEKPVIPANGKPKEVVVYSEENEKKLTKTLYDLLEYKFEPIPKEDSDKAKKRLEKEVAAKIEDLKKKVKEVEQSFYKSSISTTNLAVEAKISCEAELKNSISIKEGQNSEDSLKSAQITSSEGSNPHKKLAQVRELLVKLTALKKAIPIQPTVAQNSLYTKVNSDERSMSVDLSYFLSESDKLYDDHLILHWKQFSLGISNSKDVRLAALNFINGGVKMSLSDGSFYRNKMLSENSESVKLKVDLGPVNPTLTVPVWMKSFGAFYSSLMDRTNHFIPYVLTLEYGAKSESWKSEIPAAGIPALPNPKKETSETVPEPGFFDNLSKSYFDFIGYGFYRLIFHAILPNPEECPSATSSILNVELDLPPTTTFLFANADTGDLKERSCVASINTARPIRLWTQIVDGVLCNMYAVAEGLEEQEMAIQARVSSDKSEDIIKSFENVLKLRSPTSDIVPSAALPKDTESPLLKYQTPSSINLKRIPVENRIALITAVPVTFEILNFDRIIKIVDAIGDKRHVQLGTYDPTTTDLNTREVPSLFNVITSALAGKFPVHFNTPEQVKQALATGPRVIQVQNDKVILEVDTKSPSPNELTIKTRIKMPSRLDQDSELSDENPPYVLYETLSPEKRFLHPVVRWGETDLHFTFPDFMVSLKLTPGDIKITDDGSRILFDALKDFGIDISIKARTGGKSLKPEKELFRTSSIRQVFKRCQDYVNQSVNYSFNPDQVVSTTSVVSYGPNINQKFHFLGSADMESLFLLQGVIIRRMFAGPPRDDDETYDPKEDPTYMDFGLLISLGGGKKDAKDEDLPKLALPCFFTNLCSEEQLQYTELNRSGLLDGDYIPVNLHIRNTFLPLTASIASGFANFLTLFHMETYPKTFEWQLRVPENQVIGMEMNGQGMFYGKAGPLEIVKSAEIPYQNAQETTKGQKKKTKKKEVESGIYDENDYVPGMAIPYAKRDAFERDFYKHQLKHDFTDEVIIPVKAQVPDSLPDLLRKMLWPMFFNAKETITLHPPLVNVESSQFDELSHAPISVAISDSMSFRESNGKLTKPSLLTKLFAAFIEESSSTGMDVHSQKNIKVPPASVTLKPDPSFLTRFYTSFTGESSSNIKPSSTSCFRFHYALSIDGFDFGNIWNATSNYLSSKDLLHVVLWIQFPWALGSIGFDFGSHIKFEVKLPNQHDALLLDGFMSQHHMIGKVARMRLDLSISFSSIRAILPNVKPGAGTIGLMNADGYNRYHPWAMLLKFILPYLGEFQDLPLSLKFIVDNNFIGETEASIPRRFLRTLDPPSIKGADEVELTRTTRRIDSIMDCYEKSAPQAVACIFNREILDSDKNQHTALWYNLDLSLTRVYYGNVRSVKPFGHLQLFFQLRSTDQFPVCGLLKGVKTLAIMIEYIKPSRPLEILFQKDKTIVDPPREYYACLRDPVTSVFTADLRLNGTGRYRIYAAIQKTDDENLKKLNYREIKYTEIYVQNSR